MAISVLTIPNKGTIDSPPHNTNYATLRDEINRVAALVDGAVATGSVPNQGKLVEWGADGSITGVAFHGPADTAATAAALTVLNPVTMGGTGLPSLALGRLLVGNGTSAMTALAGTGTQALIWDASVNSGNGGWVAGQIGSSQITQGSITNDKMAPLWYSIGTTAMTVHVAPGEPWVGGTSIWFNGGDSQPISTAGLASGQARVDLLYIDASGALQWQQGSPGPAATATKPQNPTGAFAPIVYQKTYFGATSVTGYTDQGHDSFFLKNARLPTTPALASAIGAHSLPFSTLIEASVYQTSPNPSPTVNISAVNYWNSAGVMRQYLGGTYTWAQADLGTIPVGQARWDLLYLDDNRNPAAAAGAVNVSPTQPSKSQGQWPLALVYLPANCVTIVDFVNYTGAIGQGYILLTPGYFSTVTPLAAGSSAQAHVQTRTGGAIMAVAVDVPGSGYTFPPAVSFVGGGGTGATAVAVLGSGAQAGTVIRVDMTANGSGYTSDPSVVFSATGGVVPVAQGGTGGTSATLARANLSAAASGANADISSMTLLSAVTGNVAFAGQQTLSGSAVGNVPLTLQGLGGQTGDLVQYKNNTPAIVGNVTAQGNVGIGGQATTTDRNLTVFGTSAGTSGSSPAFGSVFATVMAPYASVAGNAAYGLYVQPRVNASNQSGTIAGVYGVNIVSAAITTGTNPVSATYGLTVATSSLATTPAFNIGIQVQALDVAHTGYRFLGAAGHTGPAYVVMASSGLPIGVWSGTGAMAVGGDIPGPVNNSQLSLVGTWAPASNTPVALNLSTTLKPNNASGNAYAYWSNPTVDVTANAAGYAVGYVFNNINLSGGLALSKAAGMMISQPTTATGDASADMGNLGLIVTGPKNRLVTFADTNFVYNMVDPNSWGQISDANYTYGPFVRIGQLQNGVSAGGQNQFGLAVHTYSTGPTNPLPGQKTAIMAWAVGTANASGTGMDGSVRNTVGLDVRGELRSGASGQNVYAINAQATVGPGATVTNAAAFGMEIAIANNTGGSAGAVGGVNAYYGIDVKTTGNSNVSALLSLSPGGAAAANNGLWIARGAVIQSLANMAINYANTFCVNWQGNLGLYPADMSKIPWPLMVKNNTIGIGTGVWVSGSAPNISISNLDDPTLTNNVGGRIGVASAAGHFWGGAGANSTQVNDFVVQSWQTGSGVAGRVMIGVASQTVPNIICNTDNTTLIKGLRSYIPTTQTLGNGSTIATQQLAMIEVNSGAAITGVILAPGQAGQEITIVNSSGFQISFATQATSNLVNGSLLNLAGYSSSRFAWSAGLVLWVKVA